MATPVPPVTAPDHGQRPRIVEREAVAGGEGAERGDEVAAGRGGEIDADGGAGQVLCGDDAGRPLGDRSRSQYQRIASARKGTGYLEWVRSVVQAEVAAWGERTERRDVVGGRAQIDAGGAAGEFLCGDGAGRRLRD